MQHLFGHTAERRLGLRLPTHCWALLRSGQAGTYALAVELSATGVVLELAGRHERVEFHREQRFDLDLFIPGATTPIHVAVRPVRAVGAREAFEFVEGNAVDRLTLAEHLDRLLAARRRWSFRRRPARTGRRPASLAQAWKRVLLPAKSAASPHH
jgi:hypothetical protein